MARVGRPFPSILEHKFRGRLSNTLPIQAIAGVRIARRMDPPRYIPARQGREIPEQVTGGGKALAESGHNVSMFLISHRRPATGYLEILGLTVLLLVLTVSCSEKPVYPEPSKRGADLFIDTSGMNKDVPSFYSYRMRDKSINFFLLWNDEGMFSFLDACQTCYPKKRGYRFESGYLVCNACNQKFTSQSVLEGIGGCFPIRLNGRDTEGGFLVPVAELEERAYMF